MRIRFLGSGTSQGVPMIACDCAVCVSTDPRNKRFRPSIMVETGDAHIVVDTTPDFRSQCLANNVRRLDAVLVTHTHADHVLGLDDVRRFCHGGRVLPLYAGRQDMETLGRIFPHAFDLALREPGWPMIDGHSFEPLVPFQISSTRVTALKLPHGQCTVHAFLFEDDAGPRFAYATDCKAVPPAALDRLRNVPVLVLDALRHRPHPYHLNLSEALAVVAELRPGRVWFTHICHELDHATVERELPPNVRLAYDGLVVEV
ncbi:MAG: MBL fold metallo-hydrolase [Verrucomicrobiia bacterium]|jgi:phosphoribosyl 1,2-cyclic phosphate phosphodiesterase